MSDLVTKLLAAIEDTEHVAREAADWSRGVADWADAGEPDWVHIARHDPASVLRMCSAHREIVEIHEHQKFDHPGKGDHSIGCDTIRALARAYGIEEGS